MRVEPAVPAEVLEAVRAPLAAVAPQWAEAPLTQPLGLMLDLAGEATRTGLFVVQADGGDELCLRPDFTVGVARAHLASGAAEGLYAYEGPAYRAAAGSKEPEAFIQLGLERFAAGGRDAVIDEVEIVSCAWRAARAGGREDLVLRLGDVALFAAFLSALEAPEAMAARLTRLAGRPRLLQAELARSGEAADSGALAGVLAGLSPSDAGAVLQEVWSLAGVEPVGGRGAAEIAGRLVRKAEAARTPALRPVQADSVRAFLAIDAAPKDAFAMVRELSGRPDPGLEASLAAWDRRVTALSAVAPPARLRFAAALGHAFDYYDGLTFEVISDALGPERPIASGGRYDGLMTRLGGGDGLTAVGAMVRPWRGWTEGSR